MKKTWLEPAIISLWLMSVTFVLGSVVLAIYARNTAPPPDHNTCEYPVDEVTARYIQEQLAP